jgi:hypothetical protein
MPRDEVAVNEAAVRYPVLPVLANSLDFAFTPGDAVNGLQYQATGREVVIMRNTNVGAQTFTLKSVADAESKRTGDISAYSLAAGEFSVLCPPLKGFQQADGKVYIDVSHDDVHVAVLRLPSIP